MFGGELTIPVARAWLSARASLLTNKPARSDQASGATEDARVPAWAVTALGESALCRELTRYITDVMLLAFRSSGGGMQSSRSKLVATGMLCIALVMIAGSCGKETTQPQNAQAACKDIGDASKDLQDFLNDYPSQLPAAEIALANMQSSLTAAGHAATNGPSNLFNAIQSAQHVVDTAQKALDNNQPVNTGALRTAMDDLGNACSEALGG
jgi:hypothetical protein